MLRDCMHGYTKSIKTATKNIINIYKTYIYIYIICNIVHNIMYNVNINLK
jgi:hypothetical protein